ncbi:hypothetical protein ACIGN6_30625 [Streptomyces sp. NPDC053792]|uniref:hypothetical protein n=1 Tax=Streptomyces sp. NPDC053792 TaxID=3365716 RepID=UPI0037D98225
MRIRTALSATFAMLAATLFITPSAYAAEAGTEGATGAYGCSGSLIDTRNVWDGTKTLGKLYIYYSSANGGTNCAVVVDTYFGSSVLKYMAVDISRCATSACTSTDRTQEQSDYFYQYAGPVTITGTDGHCITAGGYIARASNNAEWGDATMPVSHCG